MSFTTITGYRVGKKPAKDGPTTAWHQQWSTLRMQGNANPDPRQAFLDDLDTFLTTLRLDKKHEILLMLDANENVHDKNSKLHSLMLKHELVDLHGYLHGDDCEIATHLDGKRRIDYMFGSSGVIRNLSAAGIDAFYDGLKQSDHRSLWADIHTQELLKGDICKMAKASRRGIISTRPDLVLKYKAHVMQYLADHKVAERAQAAVADPHPPPHVLEGIDQDIIRAQRSAEKKHGNNHFLPWSPQLMSAKKRRNFWNLWLAQLRRGIDLSSQREKLLALVPELAEFITDTPPDMKEVRAQLKAAKKNQSRYPEIAGTARPTPAGAHRRSRTRK